MSMTEKQMSAVNSNNNLGDRLLLDAHDLQAAGIPRTIAYQLLNRADLPVITLGRRKFMVKAKFEKWLDENSNTQADAC